MTEAERKDQPRIGGTRLKTLLTIAFAVAGSVFVWRHLSAFRDLNWPSATSVAVVAVGFVASVLFKSLYNYYASRQLGAKISISESFMLSAVVTASNAMLPANPGAAFRAVYMKKVHAFPYAFFAGATALHFVITLLMVSVISIGLLLLIYHELGYFRLDLFVGLPAIAVAAGIGIAVRSKSSQASSEGVWSSFRSAYLSLVANRSLLATSIAIVISNFVVASIVWMIVLRDTVPGLAASEAFLFAGSQIASGLINLTPGAAGFQEIVGMYVGKTFAMSAVELFAILIWVRLVRSLSAVLIGIPCAAVLRTRTSRLNGQDKSA